MILIDLGFLFRAQPTLMTVDRSAVVMDEIFASSEEEGKGRLLRIIQDFLVSEASKHSAKEKGPCVHCFIYIVIDVQFRIDKGQNESI